MANVILSLDYGRLHSALPSRTTQRDLRAAKRSAVNLFEEVKKDGFEWGKTAAIDSDARFYISQELDRSALEVYNTAIKQIQATKEHADNYRVLADAPKNCGKGGFSVKRAILGNATPLEQMVALDHLIYAKASSWKKGVRTLCFEQRHGNVGCVPMRISSTTTVKASTMKTVFGQGPDTPKYTQFASEAGMARHSVFMEPLNALEIVRQPHFAAATVLKGNAFDAEVMDHQRRYEAQIEVHGKSQFACVELELQNHKDNSPIKEKSVATNLISLLKKHPDKRIHKRLIYEAVAHEGYKNEAEVRVTPFDLWKATEESICHQNRADLDRLMTQLFIAKVHPFSSSIVGDFYAQKVFGD